MIYFNIMLALMVLPLLSFVGSIIYVITVSSINYVEDTTHYNYNKDKLIFKLFRPTVCLGETIDGGLDLITSSLLSNLILAITMSVWPILIIIVIVFILLKITRAIRRLQKKVEKLQ